MLVRQIDEELFDHLATREGKDLITIVIPTHVRGPEIAQDPIRFKNQLSRVDEELAGRGWRTEHRADRLAAAESLVDDRTFWEHRSKGMVAYIDEDGKLETIPLHHEPDASSWVSSRFVIRPLLAELSELRIEALALSRNFVGLYSVSALDAQEIQADLPESFDDVNWFVDRETQRQQHPDRAGTARSRHGHDPNSKDDADLSRFLHEVADALPAGQRDAPLLVVGDDALVARFTNLAERTVVSPENSGFEPPMSPDEIHEMAASTVERLAEERVEDLTERTAEKLARGQATTDITEAILAAISGRIDVLVVDVGATPIWGTVDESTMGVTTSTEPKPTDADLVDLLAVIAKQNGARVEGVSAPFDHGPFVATFRF